VTLILFFPKMATLNCSETLQVITCGLKFKVHDKVLDQSIVKTVPKPVKDGEDEKKADEAGDNEVDNKMRITSSAISPCGTLLALSDDYKQLTVWQVKAGCVELKYQQELVRKGVRILFSNDSTNILVADKNGDVYLFMSSGNTEAKLILGHLSMLLDIAISKDGKFVLTADRDEKIRVSRFPNSYNIHNFCLGHKEFVTSISLLPDIDGDRELLASGSGDGTVKVWDYLEGREIVSREVFKDVTIEEKISVDKSKDESINDLTPRVEPPPQPAVVRVQALTGNLILVQLEGFKGLSVYKYKDNVLDINQVVPLSSSFLDFVYMSSSCMLFLLLRNSSSLITASYALEEGNLTLKNATSEEDADGFFAPLSDFEDEGMDSLHKKWFDNIKDYMQRKEARLNSRNSNNEPQPIKKLKT